MKDVEVMKKIGIITSISKGNYGNKLQNYALLKTLKDLGYEVETVNRKKEDKVKLIFYKLKTLIRDILKINYRSGICRRENIFRKFDKKYLNISRYWTHENHYKSGINEEFDYFVCGSDQIWNGSRRYDLVSFLGFVSDKKKIALAPSFGSEIEDYNKRSFSKEIRKFQLLSAREQEGVDNIAELTGRDAIRLSDPTSFLTPDEWRDFSKAADDLEGEYIFIHFLDKPCDFALQAMEKLRSDRGLPMVAFAYPQEEYERIKGIRFCNGGPREYVKYIDRASYVMTDSFHTTLFSIYFNTSFFTFHRQYTHNAKQTSRISNLLTLYGCEERFVADMAAFIEILDSDLPDSFEIRDKERQKLIGYLKKALDD